MASAEIFILSSSPLREQTNDIYTLSSSPLPLTSELVYRMPAVRIGSHAAVIPKDARASFTTASNLLQKPSLDEAPTISTIRSFKLDGSYTGLAESSKNTVNASKAPAPKIKKSKTEGIKSAAVDFTEKKAPRKSRAKKVESEAVLNAGKAKVPRNPRAQKVDTEAGDVAPRKDKAPRKPRTKKVEDNDQIKIPASRVTKNIPAPELVEKIPSVERISRKKLKAPRKGAAVEDGRNLNLVGAVKRRNAWTPPKADGRMTSLSQESSGGNGVHNASPDDSTQRILGFGTLLDNFSFTTKVWQENRATDDVLTRKRKRLELVTTTVVPTTTKPPNKKKDKAPKKKARTLTGLATSAYADVSPPAPASAAIQDFFGNPDKHCSTNKGFMVPPRSKKGTSSDPILLSPKSAMKQVARQDFVFGTSSQLAREKSPTLLRDLHEAMKASNESQYPFEDPFSSPVAKFDVSPVTSRPTKPKLWSAASRDEGGNLFDVEMVDMVNIVDSPMLTLPQKAIIAPIVASNKPNIEEEVPWRELDDLPVPIPTQKLTPIAGPISDNEMRGSSIVASEKLLELSDPKHKSQPPIPKAVELPEIPEVPAKSAKEAVGCKSASDQESKKPDYASFTTAQLAKKTASYHFKPIKSRGAMIILLEKCWESEYGITTAATNNVESEPTSPVMALGAAVRMTGSPSSGGRPRKDASSTISTKIAAARPRGRPREETAAMKTSPKQKFASRFQNSDPVEALEIDSDPSLIMPRTSKRKAKAKQPLEEISDSEGPDTPSPLRQASNSKRAPATLPLDTVDHDDTLLLSPISRQRHVFHHITEAILRATPTKVPDHPSWHEKILMYDPIILEDLAAWLNTGALDRVGYDGEVEPKEVKKWCESKSICCLWRDNLRGGARVRY